MEKGGGRRREEQGGIEGGWRSREVERGAGRRREEQGGGGLCVCICCKEPSWRSPAVKRRNAGTQFAPFHPIKWLPWRSQSIDLQQITKKTQLVKCPADGAYTHRCTRMGPHTHWHWSTHPYTHTHTHAPTHACAHTHKNTREEVFFIRVRLFGFHHVFMSVFV